ncbi:MAG: diacylglycerol kinase [Planctomycetota bacterium]|jgi:diacylglycerol kinase (ATP)|nr:diacylglycerol kinase [Planctomycetota bacterium]
MFQTIINIPRRIRKAAGYTWSGLKHLFRKEESFRVEMLVLAALAAVAAATPWPAWKKFALAAAYLLVPLAETLNSCLEDLCDLVKPEYHPGVKNVKDKASAAVLFAIFAAALALVALILA